MCQRTEKLKDLSMDPNNDGGCNIVPQTNIVTIQSTPPQQQPPLPPPPPIVYSSPASSPLPLSSPSSPSLGISMTTIEINTSETNGKYSPAAALSPSSIILSPCDDNEKPNNGTCNTDDELDEVTQFFDKKLHVIEKWLRDRAPPEIQLKLHDAIDPVPKSPKLRTSSVTSDLFQQWLASSPMQVRIHIYKYKYKLIGKVNT